MNRGLVFSVMLLSLTSASRAVQIRIQFLNGKSGRPIAKTSVVINDMTKHQLIGVLKTDQNGFVAVDIDPQSQILANVERTFHQSCDVSKNELRTYDAQQIISTGIVEQNQCGAKLSEPTPGTLVRVFRKSTFVEALREN